MSGHTFKDLVFLCVLVLLAANTSFALNGNTTEKSLLSVYRPSTASFHSRSQSDDGSYSVARLGSSTDVLVPADYDGDGEIDIAIWRPSNGLWQIQLSATGTTLRQYWGATTVHPTGALPDVPVPADFDGDGKTDLAVWRPDTGVWYVLLSTESYDVKKARYQYWGKLGDIPVVADYDGDGKADAAVFRYWENNWYICESSSDKMTIHNFGIAGDDRLVPADYTGDGKADIAVYRRGTWHILDSSTGEADTFRLGFDDSIPVPNDYDGDGVTDMAVYQEGTWYIYESKTPKFVSHIFGLAGDIPLASLGAKPSIIGVP